MSLREGPTRKLGQQARRRHLLSIVATSSVLARQFRMRARTTIYCALQSVHWTICGGPVAVVGLLLLQMKVQVEQCGELLMGTVYCSSKFQPR